MQNAIREEKRRAKAKHIMERLMDGSVIVEGKHDKKALARLGVESITYNALMSNGIALDPRKPVYLLMDLDNGGEEKARKATSALLERSVEFDINTDLGKSLLAILRAKHAEDIVAPYTELVDVNAVKDKKAKKWQKHI